ncbi:AAA family ATPase [Halobacillus amylolyticus]|uniref:Type VII secretion protein EssB n=1 Tax=Halobacillus amylolyticus TaxID=2932259 RepID=A0ABY4HGR0_9BACI|nr:hypothetical protein [Halobacillus amylolyticus]UOR14077.1 hypothetical protein MUO15_21210 [Halobacillus amylolyticus]
MYRTVANKNGTIEVNGDVFRFYQPADEYKTENREEIEESYTNKMDSISDDPHFITAQNIESRNGQVIFEYSLKGLKMFDYLRTLFLEEKIYYYRSLIEMAKREDVNVLWQKENFAIDPHDQTMKSMVIEHDAFELYEQKDNVQAIKELVILSLTSMTRVFGKPRRADFLEQNENVIHFAEKLYLKAKTLEEMEEYINGEIYRIDMRKKEKAQTALNQSKWASLLSKAKIKRDGELKESRQEMVASLEEDSEGEPSENQRVKKSGKSDKKLYGALAGAVLCAIILSVFLSNINEKSQTNTATASQQSQAKGEIVTIYRDSFFENPESTIKKLEEIGYGNLKEADRKILNHLYVEAGKMDKAIQNDPKMAGEVAEKLYQEEKQKELEDLIQGLEKPNDTASLYLAMLQEDWGQITSLHEGMTLNNEQINAVLTAYLQLGDVEKAEEFVQGLETPSEELQKRMDKALDLQKQIYAAENEKAQLKKELDDTDDKEKQEEISQKIEELNQKVDDLKNQLTSV